MDCIKCHNKLTEDEIPRGNRGHFICTACRKEKEREMNRNYYNKHKDAVKARFKAWKTAHREYILNMPDEDFLDIIYPDRHRK